MPGPEAIKMNKILRLKLSVYWEETQPCTLKYGSRIIDVGAGFWGAGGGAVDSGGMGLEGREEDLSRAAEPASPKGVPSRPLRMKTQKAGAGPHGPH